MGCSSLRQVQSYSFKEEHPPILGTHNPVKPFKYTTIVMALLYLLIVLGTWETHVYKYALLNPINKPRTSAQINLSTSHLLISPYNLTEVPYHTPRHSERVSKGPNLMHAFSRQTILEVDVNNNVTPRISILNLNLQVKEIIPRIQHLHLLVRVSWNNP